MVFCFVHFEEFLMTILFLLFRSSSIDEDSGRGSSSSRSKPSLKRKSLSLEQTTGKNEQLIWGTDSNVSSIQSLDSEADTRHFSLQRDSSVDR